jgi:acetolactate synthase I/II/III large subunit
MKASDLFVRCLENEGVEYIFGIPGEENADTMLSLNDSPIDFVLCRHEQAAAFAADVYGRLTGKSGVCLATLGPGATNLVTGVADANMARAGCDHHRTGVHDAAAQGEPSEHGRDRHVPADLQMGAGNL